MERWGVPPCPVSSGRACSIIVRVGFSSAGECVLRGGNALGECAILQKVGTGVMLRAAGRGDDVC